MGALLPRKKVNIGMVLALTGPFQPGRVLERLGHLLEGIGSSEVATVTVDRDAVRRRVLRRLAPRSWLRIEPLDLELEIAAEGLRRLRRQFRPRLLLVATDALLEREDRDLACVDRYALDFALHTGRSLGFFAPASLLSRLADRAPAPTLARDLVVVPLAGVRGSVISRRVLGGLWDGPDPTRCCDLRVVHRLGLARLDPRRMSEELLARLAGPVEAGAARIDPAEHSHSIDSAEFPAEIRHGQRLPVKVRGWISGVPPVRTVEVRAGLSSATAPVTVHRPDVVAIFENVREEVCGFDLAAELGPFEPGTYAVVFSAPGTDRKETLGSFGVVPALEIGALDVLAPGAFLADGTAPLGIEVRVLSTRAAWFELRVDDTLLDPLRAPSPGPRRAGEPEMIDFRAHHLLRAPGTDVLVEARAASEPDLRAVCRVPVRLEAGGGAPLRWKTREIGIADAARRATPVHLAGVLFAARAGDRLALRRDGEPLAGIALVPWEGGQGSPGIATFELRREIGGIPPGRSAFELATLHTDGSDEVLDRWSAEVIAVTHGLEVSSVEITADGPAQARVVLEGRLDGGTGIDALLLFVGDALRARLGAEWLEPASAFQGAGATFHFFRFDSTIPLAEGRHRLEVRTRRGTLERSAWRREVDFRRADASAEIRVLSADLDRLLRADLSPVWSRLEISGTVVGGSAGDTVDLVLSRRVAASATVAADGSFSLLAHPRDEEEGEGGLVVSRGATCLARSPAFRIAPRALLVPAASVAHLEGVLTRLLPNWPGARSFAAESTLRALFEREPGAIGEFRSALALLDRNSRRAEQAPGEVLLDPPAEPHRRLRVLFAAWEPPCGLHGGGVAIKNTLRALGPRHEITLIHTCAPGEEGLSDEVRPWVKDLIAVRRDWRPPNFETGLGVPPAFAWSFSPRYREAIEGELATGRYELFNGDFLRTALHTDVSGRASIGVSHEVESFAAALTIPESFASSDAAAEWLAPFLRSLFFEAVYAPARFSEYVTVTEPEARFLARLLPSRRLFVSPIPIDIEALGAAADLRAPAPVPLFLFFGNFIHPPNREAARLLAEEIAPRVHARRPECRFVIAGSNPPAELVAGEGRFGVHVPGFVPDLTELTATCTAVLAPIFHGAGMRVKLLEAMAAGCPVVSTSLGFSGIEGEAGKSWLLADSVDAFVDAALRLAAEAGLGRELGREGRALVGRVYGIDAQGQRRERIWNAALRAFAAGLS